MKISDLLLLARNKLASLNMAKATASALGKEAELVEINSQIATTEETIEKLLQVM